MTNLDSVFNSRDIPFLAKVRIVKAMIFPVVIYKCESWIIKKQSIVVFKLVLDKTLESPLDSKIKPVDPKGNQS